jgi:hypothetical protein
MALCASLVVCSDTCCWPGCDGIVFARSATAEVARDGDVQKIVQGEATRMFTTQLNEHFSWSKTFAKFERAVRWNLARDAGPNVRVGCDGWFFCRKS